MRPHWSDVMVLDAKTGRLVSLNRETKRLVESLGQPGHRKAWGETGRFSASPKD